MDIWQSRNEKIRAVIKVYSRVHPSVFAHSEFFWRIGKETLTEMVREFRGSSAEIEIGGSSLFGLPIEVTETEEILLVLKVE